MVNAGGRAPALLGFTFEINFLTKHICDCRIRFSPGEQNGVHDRLCYFLAETFASDVVGSEVLAGINSAPAKLMVLWAPGYEGSGAVLVGSGSQVGLSSVLGFPSLAASSIAVTGRQNW